MKQKDIKITQKNVDKFFNEIHADVLIDSIKMPLNENYKEGYHKSC